jgi:hypothetical protein
MVEYAILLARNSTQLMGGFRQNVVSWASRLDWTTVILGAGGIFLLWLAVSTFWPSRRY